MTIYDRAFFSNVTGFILFIDLFILFKRRLLQYKNTALSSALHNNTYIHTYMHTALIILQYMHAYINNQHKD